MHKEEKKNQHTPDFFTIFFHKSSTLVNVEIYKKMQCNQKKSELFYNYSPARARTGSSFAALAAGFRPKKIPTKTEKMNEMMQASQLTM